LAYAPSSFDVLIAGSPSINRIVSLSLSCN
jgi:hypothetical protein